MTQGVILELSDSDKDPGFFGQTKFGVGAVAAGIAYVCLLVGLQSDAGGTIVDDAAPEDVTTPDEIDDLAGAGGELARMGYAGLRIPGVRLKIASVTPAGGAAAAEATITIGGTWTKAGEWRYRVAGDEISGGIAATDDDEAVAAAIAAYITARPRLAVSADATGAVVTLTWKSSTIRGNDGILVQDVKRLPAGATSAIAGGAATTNGGVRFDSGAGTEDVEDLLTVLHPGRYHRIAAAQNDATNLGKWETQLDDKAGPFENRTEHALFGINADDMADATAIAQTTLNNWRCEVMWMRNGETPAPEMAAVFAAYRSVLEQTNPNQNYDGYALPGVYPHTAEGDKPNRATRVAALDAGITPVTTSPTKRAVIVRAITTRSLTDTGNADDRTVDVSESATPDWVRDNLQIFWEETFRVANPKVQDDVADGQPEPPAGVATPALWNNEVMAILLGYEADGILTRVLENPSVSKFNVAAKRIATRVPTVVLPLQHQMELSVEQVPLNSAA